MVCPLCNSAESIPFFEDARRAFLRCSDCSLTFVPSRYYLSGSAEKAEYDHHENSPNDLGYRHFLSRMLEPIEAALDGPCAGLDFGCGPGPTLSVMLEERGHSVALYDMFYYPDTSVFDLQYDFITATEVAEHLHRPMQELDRLWGCLRPGGVLGIMTKMARDKEAFSGWHYKNDLTHVCFFSRETFLWLAGRLGAEITFHGADVVLLRKG